MSIESGSTATSPKLFGTVDHRAGKRVGKADTAVDGNNNFSMLMGMLAAADATNATESIGPSGDAVAGFVVSNALVDPVAYDSNRSLTQSKCALTATNSEAPTALVNAVKPALVASMGNLAGLTLDAKGEFQATNAGIVAQPSNWAISHAADLEEQLPLDQSAYALEASNLKALPTQQEGGVAPRARSSAVAQAVSSTIVGIGTLDAKGKVPLDQLAYALEASNLKALPTQQEGGVAPRARSSAVAQAVSSTIVGIATLDAEGKVPLDKSDYALAASNLQALPTQQEGGVAPRARSSAVAQAVSSTIVGIGTLDAEGKVPLDQSAYALAASNLKATLVSPGSGPVREGPPVAGVDGMVRDRSGGLLTIKAGPMPVAAGSGADKVALNGVAGGVGGDRSAAGMSIDARQGVAAQTEVRSVGNSPVSAQNLSAAQADMKEARTHVSTVDMAARSEVGSTLALLNGTADDLVRMQERGSTPSAGARFGDASAGNFGFAAGVSSRADAPYEIEATAAAVPDTAIAETVSYWVAQGVQSAELTLDGFGSDPVEVSISLNGDQAQVDFRTDQADVRQLLEAATAELRELLSGEGLQLAGVSVGASGGRSAQGEAQQPSPGAKPVEIVPEQVASTTRSRNSNPSVGRSLDLFV